MTSSLGHVTHISTDQSVKSTLLPHVCVCVWGLMPLCVQDFLHIFKKSKWLGFFFNNSILIIIINVLSFSVWLGDAVRFGAV